MLLSLVRVAVVATASVIVHFWWQRVALWALHLWGLSLWRSWLRQLEISLVKWSFLNSNFSISFTVQKRAPTLLEYLLWAQIRPDQFQRVNSPSLWSGHLQRSHCAAHSLVSHSAQVLWLQHPPLQLSIIAPLTEGKRLLGRLTEQCHMLASSGLDLVWRVAPGKPVLASCSATG